jgi:hypothetical protein
VELSRAQSQQLDDIGRSFAGIDDHHPVDQRHGCHRPATELGYQAWASRDIVAVRAGQELELVAIVGGGEPDRDRLLGSGTGGSRRYPSREVSLGADPQTGLALADKLVVDDVSCHYCFI